MRSRILFLPALLLVLIAFWSLRQQIGTTRWEEEHPNWIWWALAGCSILFVLAYKIPKAWSSATNILFPVALLLCIGLNLTSFSSLNRRSTWPLLRHNDDSLLHQAQKSPQPLARTTFALYYFIHDHLKGKTIVSYTTDILEPSYLHRVSRIGDFVIDTNYRHTLTASQSEDLLTQPHTILRHDGRDECVFVLHEDRCSNDRTFYVMRGRSRYYVVPAHIVEEWARE